MAGVSYDAANSRRHPVAEPAAKPPWWATAILAAAISSLSATVVAGVRNEARLDALKESLESIELDAKERRQMLKEYIQGRLKEIDRRVSALEKKVK